MSLHENAENEPRLVVVSRRAFLKGGAAVGALIAVPLLASCGNDDAAVFAEAATSTTSAADGHEPSTESSDSTVAPTTSAEAASTSSGASGAVFPTGAELAVAFTYQAEAGGDQVRNPYIAVWIEDTAGELVDTISVWYLQSQKGLRWIDDLRRWYTVSHQAADITMSGATRVAGSYTVVWDGTDLEGNPVAYGDYIVYIEAAREHGPYSITSTPISIADAAFSTPLADEGEIVAASAELLV